MKRAAKILLIVLAATMITLPLSGQIVVSPNFISAQSGTSLYCAARYLNPQVQLYCYSTNATPWDHLAYNSIFYVDLNTAIVPTNLQICLPATAQTGACSTNNIISFIFTRPGAAINYQMTLNGSPVTTGTFQ